LANFRKRKLIEFPVCIHNITHLTV
jgi:hypothetical protein